MNIPINLNQCTFCRFGKKDGSWRLCVDYRKLNQVTLVQQELMPNPEQLPKARISMKIGHTRGYWQIKIDVSSKPCTAFSSPLGNLQFCHLTLGLASVPSTFTKLIRKLTLGCKHVVSYLDDILIFHAID